MKVEDSVLLEDGAEHGLDDNTWAWVGDEGRLFVQLLGEEVNAQVSVLASSVRGGDLDDLARTALKDQEVTSANVVAWDGDSVGRTGRTGGVLGSRLWNGDVNFFLHNMLMVIMMVRTSVKNTIRRTVKTMTEGVIVS